MVSDVTMAKEIYLAQYVPSYSTAMHTGGFFSAGNYPSEFEVNVYLLLVSSQGTRGGIPLFHNNQLRYLLYRSTQAIRSASGAGSNSRRISFSSNSD
jgi:hypothetical protein